VGLADADGQGVRLVEAGHDDGHFRRAAARWGGVAHGRHITTARGSAQRTGCVDDQAGPKAPAVIWAYKAQENYVASPLLEGSAVYFPALGPFNTGLFHCLAAQDNQPRLLWSKQAPVIKRPLVCSPVASEGLLIFGDGMHQTYDAMLYCVMADTGRPVWQYPLQGKFMHLEASPTVNRGRVYTGGGDAGGGVLGGRDGEGFGRSGGDGERERVLRGTRADG
jgi:hypothetical protein